MDETTTTDEQKLPATWKPCKKHGKVPCSQCKRHTQNEQRWHNYLAEYQRDKLDSYTRAQRGQIMVKLRKRNLLPPKVWSSHPVSAASRMQRHEQKAELQRLTELQKQMEAKVAELAKLASVVPGPQLSVASAS